MLTRAVEQGNAPLHAQRAWPSRFAACFWWHAAIPRRLQFGRQLGQPEGVTPSHGATLNLKGQEGLMPARHVTDMHSVYTQISQPRTAQHLEVIVCPYGKACQIKCHMHGMRHAPGA